MGGLDPTIADRIRQSDIRYSETLIAEKGKSPVADSRLSDCLIYLIVQYSM